MPAGQWKGTKTRNRDGRTGTVTSEFIGFGHRMLTITASDDSKAQIQLNVEGDDSGEPGWEWCYHRPDGTDAWYPLGPHL